MKTHARRIGAIAALLVALIALAPASVAGAHTNGGNATPGNDGWHPWPTDGCSTSWPSWNPIPNVSSVAGIFNFRHACVHHDGCYTGFPSNGRATYWTNRWQCDAWFLYDMQASCRWQHGDPTRTFAGRLCMQWASNYHYAVRTKGSGAYKGPWNN